MNRLTTLLAVAAFVLIAAAGGVAWYVSTTRVPPATPPWERVAPLPTPRSEMVAAELDGIIYVPGGLGALGATHTTFEAYDPAADAWSTLPSLPNGVHHPGVAAAGGLVLVIGGFSGLDFTVGTDEAWAFDPALGAWRALARMPGRRGAHALVALGDRVLVVGGVGDAPQEVWSYDLAADTWSTRHAPLPTAREHLAAVLHDGRVYVIAGRWHGTGNLGTVEIYDPAEDAWSSAPDLPTPRSGLTAVAAGGRIHVAGGEDLDAGRTFDTHEIFEIDADAWRAGVPLTAPRHGLASAVVAGRWHVIGGATRPGAETVISLTSAFDVLDLAEALAE